MSLGITLAPYGQIPGSFPYEIGYSYGGNGTYMAPYDPNYYQNGEAGFYHDTQLGGLGATAQEYPVILAMLSAQLQAAINKQQPKKKKRLGLIYTNPVAPLTTAIAARKTKKFSGLGTAIPGDNELTDLYSMTPHMTGWVSSKQGFVQSSWIPPNEWRPAPLNGLSGPAGPRVQLMGNLGDIDPDVAKVLQVMNDQNRKMFGLTLIATVAVAVSAIVSIMRNSKLLKQEQQLMQREIAVRS